MQTRKNDLMQLGVMLIAAALAVFAALWLGKVLYGLANVALVIGIILVVIGFFRRRENQLGLWWMAELSYPSTNFFVKVSNKPSSTVIVAPYATWLPSANKPAPVGIYPRFTYIRCAEP